MKRRLATVFTATAIALIIPALAPASDPGCHGQSCSSASAAAGR
jgi:hypothetical protein